MDTCTQCYYKQKGTLILEGTSFGVRVAVQEVWRAVGEIGRGKQSGDDWMWELA